MPDIVKKAGNKDLRIWSAGCSSGEEPYTLAIIIDEFFGKEKLFWDSKILATDISSRMLEKAQKRIYGNEEIAALPVNWRLSYFSKYDQDRSVISDRIRNEVIFRRFNLMEKCFPFKRKFHVIFCRNVMIYFNNETKWGLLDKFYNLMEDGAYLFLGLSESLGRDHKRFVPVMPSVYRKA